MEHKNNKSMSNREVCGKKETSKRSSDRSFGIVFCVVFSVIGFWPMLDQMSPYIWAISISIVLLAISVIYPRLLRGLNLLWYRFGLLLHSVMTPFLLGLIFFSTFVPIGFIMRLMGKRPLPTSFNKSKDSYWIEKGSAELKPETMKRQF